MTGLLAVAVSGTFNSFTSGAVIKSSEVNTNFATLKTAVEGITSSQWTTSGANIGYTAGNVGIGTTNPLTLLHLSSDVGSTIFVDGHSNSAGAPPTINFRRARGTASSPQAVLSGDEIGYFSTRGFNGASFNYAAIMRVTATENWTGTANGAKIDFMLNANGASGVGSIPMTINQNGFIGFGGATSPGSPLVVGTTAANGNGASVTAGGTWTNGSSKFTKKNITDLPSKDATVALMKLEPKIYNYKNEEKETYVGFLAEDVPELVAMNNRKTLSTMDIAAVTVKVVQDQQNTIKNLEKENSELKNRLSKMEESVKSMLAELRLRSLPLATENPEKMVRK